MRPTWNNEGGEQNGRWALCSAREVLWQLMFEGVLAPGSDSYNIDLPWVLVTRYGREVLKAGPANLHDRSGYLRHLYEDSAAAGHCAGLTFRESELVSPWRRGGLRP
jgi:hypothetical protein